MSFILPRRPVALTFEGLETPSHGIRTLSIASKLVSLAMVGGFSANSKGQLLFA